MEDGGEVASQFLQQNRRRESPALSAVVDARDDGLRKIEVVKLELWLELEFRFSLGGRMRGETAERLLFSSGLRTAVQGTEEGGGPIRFDRPSGSIAQIPDRNFFFFFQCRNFGSASLANFDLPY